MGVRLMKDFEIEHTLQLVGYHLRSIMTQDTKITCSPHRDIPVFEHDLTEHNRIYVGRLYMEQVAKLFAA